MAFGSDGCAIDRAVNGEDGGDVGVELFGGALEEVVDSFHQHDFDLEEGGEAEFFFCQEVVTCHPGEGDELQGASAGFDDVEAGAVGDGDAFDVECVEDFDRVGASCGGRYIVVADQDDDGKASKANAANAAGKFPLVGGVGGAVFVDVASDEDDIDALREAVVDRFVEAGKVVF